jgi:hypothetical protein
MDPDSGSAWSVRQHLRPGDLVFADRPYRLRQLSAALGDAEWVLPAAAAKFQQSDPLAIIHLTEEADVFVAVEETFVPAWLDRGWEPTTLTASFGGLDGVPVRTIVFKRRFPAGQVPLGPHGNPETGMYFVAVK